MTGGRKAGCLSPFWGAKMIVMSLWSIDIYWCWFSDVWMTHTHNIQMKYTVQFAEIVTGSQFPPEGTVASKDLSSMAPQAVLAFVWVARWKWQCWIGASYGPKFHISLSSESSSWSLVVFIDSLPCLIKEFNKVSSSSHWNFAVEDLQWICVCLMWACWCFCCVCCLGWEGQACK